MDSKNPKISVIVPVYKVEAYLHQCIDSILAQTFTDFELILVDDGSPDNSGIICDDYAKTDSRIVVVHQPNGGAAIARNVGLDVMRGTYVAFIDSDDYIAKEYLELLYNSICETESDLALCNWYMFEDGDNEKLTEHCYTKERMVITGNELSRLRYVKGIVISPWGKLIHRDLFADLRFPKGMACEDQAVIPKVFYFTQRACLNKELLYFYRVRINSISHERFSVKYYDNIILMNEHIRFLKKEQEQDLYEMAVDLRDRVLAQYTIGAKVNKIKDVPKECKIGIIKALCILRKTCDDDTFTWNLAKVYPWAVRPYAYFRKIESILTGKPL